eukprot:12743809-Alexandrium_andersonii.AAC.1
MSRGGLCPTPGRVPSHRWSRAGVGPAGSVPTEPFICVRGGAFALMAPNVCNHLVTPSVAQQMPCI